MMWTKVEEWTKRAASRAADALVVDKVIPRDAYDRAYAILAEEIDVLFAMEDYPFVPEPKTNPQPDHLR